MFSRGCYADSRAAALWRLALARYISCSSYDKRLQREASILIVRPQLAYTHKSAAEQSNVLYNNRSLYKKNKRQK